jgi:hypothetical protein
MTKMPAEVFFQIEPEKAWALAQFVKLVGWSEIRSKAVSDEEAYTMRDALGEFAKALSDAGFSPR